MLQVGQAARHLGVNPQTLYFYERIGLIPPPARGESGYRLYGTDDLDRLAFIVRAKRLGLSLEEIRDFLALKAGEALSCQAVRDRLLAKVRHLETEIQQRQQLRDELLPLLDRCQAQIDAGADAARCIVLDTATALDAATARDAAAQPETDCNRPPSHLSLPHPHSGAPPMSVSPARQLEILGTGCKKCQQLEANARAAVAALQWPTTVTHVTDAADIALRGVLKTPALAIDGRVVATGKLLSPEAIQKLLQPQA